MGDSKTPLSASAQVRKWVEDNDGFFDPYRDAITREERFLNGHRYAIDNGPEREDRRLTQIRGQEIQDTIRHFAAEATAHPRSVEARPVDSDTDPDAAEVEVALIDQELKNPWKGFEARYYDCVLDSREKRMGILWMDWEPEVGPYGEILYRTIDPRRAMWSPGYDPHHPMCDVFLEKRRCDVDWVHENYKGTEWVVPDHQTMDEAGRKPLAGTPIILGADGHAMTPTASARDNKAELWFCWYKNDRTAKYRDTGKELMLKPEDRYMACTNGCGYRSPSEGELQQQVGEDGSPKLVGELPEELDGCPDCADNGQNGTLRRIDARAEQEQVLAYSKGKRLVIIAPFCASPDDKPVYDGKWPIPSCRSFPALFLWSYLDPRKPMGKSDVTLMWDQQVASDNLATMALQRVFEHRNYWELPAAGMMDGNGQRFTFRDDQSNVMFRDATKASMGSLEVNVHQGSGLDAPGWQLAWNAVQDKLTRYRGVTDYGITPDSTKNIAVGTVERLTQQGNIPVEEYNRRKGQELSKMYGVLSDMIHATYTTQRLTRLNIDGMDLVVKMWGQDMPNFDFVVEETPPFTGVEKARSEAFNGLMQVIPLSAQVGIPADRLIEIYADINNLPRSVVRKLQKEMAEVAAQQQSQMAQQGEMPGGAQAGGGDPLAQMMGGEQNPGMVPESVA